MSAEKNFLVWNLGSILKASKNVDYKNNVLAQCTVIFGFLKAHNLILIDPFDESGFLKQDLIIYRNDLTSVGLEMFKKAIPSWFKARDKDGNLDNLTILKKGIEKIKNS
jgi:hypothetical protein